MPTNQSREDPEGGKLRKSNARGHPSYDTVRNTRFTEALPENCVEVPADLPDACSRFATLRGRNPISSRSILAGCVTIDQVVFEPKHLNVVLARHSLPIQPRHDWSLAASGRGGGCGTS